MRLHLIVIVLIAILTPATASEPCAEVHGYYVDQDISSALSVRPTELQAGAWTVRDGDGIKRGRLFIEDGRVTYWRGKVHGTFTEHAAVFMHQHGHPTGIIYLDDRGLPAAERARRSYVWDLECGTRLVLTEIDRRMPGRSDVWVVIRSVP